MKKISFIFIFIISFIITSVSAQEISIVQFSDIHLDTINKSNKSRKFEQSSIMLEKAINKTNNLSPDIVVISGDMVNRPVESEFDKFLNIASKFKTQYYPILGNHDVGVGGGLSKNTIIKKLNQKNNWLNLQTPYYYVIKGNYIFIFMDGTTDKTITSTGYFAPAVLNFLDKTLSDNPTKKAIIIQHFPLMPPFKSTSHEITNKNDYFAIINKHPNVIMLLSGHYHASNAIVKNNVLYITTPSLIEYPHAFRYLTVNDDDKDTVTITSQLFLDKEQNASELSSGPYSALKLGQKSDNYFTIKLKNNTPNYTIDSFLNDLQQLPGFSK